VTEALARAGYDATHVRDHGLLSASDEQILKHGKVTAK
jgi:predicted nuclease of predicted toxin-antitoxin system